MKQDRKESGSRPGWRGPGSTKASKSSEKSKTSKFAEGKTSGPPISEGPHVSIELQQQLLNVFKNAFPSLAEGGADSLKPLLQEIKQALFERDFDRAFGRKDYLEAYAFRWSPSRSLCYLSILIDLYDHLSGSLLFGSTKNATSLSEDETGLEGAEHGGSKPTQPVICLGGGAAEVVAFAGLFKYLMSKSSPAQAAQSKEGFNTTEASTDMKVPNSALPLSLDTLLIDTAPWGDVVNTLSSTLISPPALSKYASAAARALNTAFLPSKALTTTFQCSNLLTMSASQLKESLGDQQQQKPLLITLLFTLNELYTSSITATTAFLLNLTAAVMQGTLLLVVDSPGSYSEAVLGKDRKRYPIQWLMDRTLLGDRGNGREGDEVGPLWEKLEGDESRWFRMPEELKYPISLENMRYQIHLFRRI